MATDEMIFRGYIKDRIPVFRIYSWSIPSFTYGLSQDPARDINIPLCHQDGIGMARRITGGGVLSHHDEITYSFVCGKEDIGDNSVFASYRKICSFLILFYESLGLKPRFACEEADFSNRNMASPICSASREKYDIVINGRKIGGNAQKRSRDTIFQHGSIPLKYDWHLMRKYLISFPESLPLNITSLSRELDKVPEKEIMEERLIGAFSSFFGVNYIN